MPRPQADNRPKEVGVSFWLWISTFVLGGVALLFGLIGLVVGLPSASGLTSVLGLRQLLLLIGAIVAMFLPPANAWFRPRQPGF